MKTAAELAAIWHETRYADAHFRLTSQAFQHAAIHEMQRFLDAAGLAPQPQIGHASTLGYIHVAEGVNHMNATVTRGGILFPTQQQAQESAAGSTWQVAAVIPLHLLDGDGGAA